MKKNLIIVSLLFTFLSGSVLAQDRSDLAKLQRLQLSENQVQTLFSIFLSRAPSLLTEEADAEALISELAPQALNILNRDQKRILRDLAPERSLRRFGNMNQDQRTRFVLNSARSLVHPSKEEWIDRMEEMVR